ncbi:hypothetical protein NWF24_04075 [Variovorax paradoxus]|uniref:hypothetical protein n=1 Tax=Variovorax paradoxus TaxID=34073 RepID=UPI0021AC47C1|nr:hypothetical protein [Variovorax paradoxus]UVH58596.1 hypothetical protein NWF24_04075 [Variovorax paradoxus]
MKQSERHAPCASVKVVFEAEAIGGSGRKFEHPKDVAMKFLDLIAFSRPSMHAIRIELKRGNSNAVAHWPVELVSLCAAWQQRCAAPGYLMQRGRPKRWADLQAHNCLSFSLSNLSRPDE